MMPNVQKVCRTCDKKAKRALLDGVASVGCRGIHETASEMALCPDGHGEMVRLDGCIEGYSPGTNIRIVTGRRKP